MAVKKGTLSIDSENIFPIIKKWVYSDHDIFVRELVSNGCDAITKLKKLDMMGEYELPDNYKAKIQVIVNPEEKTLKFIDNGLGMTAEEVEKYIIPIGDKEHRKYVKWNDLRERINDILVSDECKVNEDKLLGPFFISKSMLESACEKEDRFIKAFESKVIMYLFEDVMKMRPANIFKGHKGKMIFSEICKTFEEKGEGLFGISDIEYIEKEGQE